MGPQAAGEALQEEVAALAGERYRRQGGTPGIVQWGKTKEDVFEQVDNLPDTCSPRQIISRTCISRAIGESLFRTVKGSTAALELEAGPDAKEDEDVARIRLGQVKADPEANQIAKESDNKGRLDAEVR